MSAFLVYFLFLLSVPSAFALGTSSHTDTKTLSEHPTWLHLLHYEKGILGKSSKITTPGFFLSPTGSTDPEAELQATIKGLKLETNSCRYPARRQFLKARGFVFPEFDCPELRAWTREDSLQSISIIFASGYFGNPASFFGHPLLKLNFKDGRSPLDLLDTAVNYGAFTPPDVSPLPYAFFGIFGGYKAGFSDADFFFHRNNYSELELRDLWEYELKIDQSKSLFLAYHLWELRGTEFPYYFFTDNCAYRMGGLLELVVDEDLAQRNHFYALPMDLFFKLVDKKLVNSLKLIPSRQTRLETKFESLEDAEKKHIKRLISDKNFLESPDFTALSLPERSKLLNVGLEFYSLQTIKDPEGDHQQQKNALLKERLKLPGSEQKWKEADLIPPHKAQRPSLIRAKYESSRFFTQVYGLKMRPVFYDLISPEAGRPEGSELSVFDTNISLSSGKVWLQSLGLLSIENLNLSRTALPQSGGYAWRIKTGVEQLTLACNDCETLYLKAGIGKAIRAMNHLSFYAYLEPRVLSSQEASGNFSLAPIFGTLFGHDEWFKIRFEMERRHYSGSREFENLFRTELRLGNSPHFDVRLNYDYHIDHRAGAALSYYW